MNSFATRDDVAGGARAPRRPVGRTCPPTSCRTRCPSSAPTTLEPVAWPADPALEWAPPGHGDLYTALGDLRHAGGAARRAATATPSSPTPTTSARCWTRASSRGSRPSGAPFLMEVADRTSSDRKGGHLARRRRRRPAAARDRPDARGRRRRLPGHLAPPLLQHEHAVGRPARAARRAAGRRRARPADDRQPQDGRPDRHVVAGGAPARDRDGRGDRRLRGRARRCACRARASRRSRPPTTCSSLRSDAYVLGEGRAVTWRPSATACRRSWTSTPTTTSWSPTSTRASPPGAPSLVACDALRSCGDVTFGAGVVVKGDVTVEGVDRVEDGAVLEG